MKAKLSPGQFYGEVLKRCEAGSFILSETCYSQGCDIPRHSHQCAYFSIVLKGGYTQTYGTRVRSCRPLMVAFHPSDEPHSARFPHSAVRSFNIEINSSWLERAREQGSLLNDSADFHGDIPSWLALKLYKEYKQMDGLSLLAIEAMVVELLVETSRRFNKNTDRKPPLWLVRAREFLHERFSETFSLSEIAAMVGVHPIYLASEFRKHYRCTIGAYQRRLRVEFACRQLSDSADSLVEIALSAGFSHQGHFSTTFKRITGLTPTQYRSALH